MIAVVVWGAAIVAFGLSNTLWFSLAMLTIAGAGDMVSGIFRMTILQAAVEDSMRGPARRDRHGRVGDRAVARRVGVRSGRVDLDRAGQRGVGRPADDRRRSGVLALLVPAFARYDAKHPVP